MAGDHVSVQDWWGTLNRMSKAELYFEQTLDARNDISKRKPRAMIKRDIGRGPPIAKEYYFKPGELLEDLEEPEEPDSHRAGYLITLEDLSREWVEALGPRLGIPVYVFALHWADPSDHVNRGLRVPIGESPARHFILSYRQSLPFYIKNRQNKIIVNGVDKGQLRRWTSFKVKGLVADSNPELEYRLDCNVVRPITSHSDKDEDNEPEPSEQLVTYYTIETTETAASSKEHYVPCPLEVTCAHQCLDSPTCRSNDSDIGYSSPQSCSVRGWRPGRITRRVQRTRNMCVHSLSGYTTS